MMRCLQVTKLISQSQERKLTYAEKLGMIPHLAICFHCRNFNKNCRTLRKMMQKFAQENEQ